MADENVPAPEPGKDEPPVEPAVDPGKEEPGKGDPPVEPGKDEPPVEPGKDEPPAEPGKDEPPSEEGDDAPEFYFGEQKVNVEVPDDLKAAFESKGVDVEPILAELYAKDGDFSLSEETKGKLDEAFGKPLVDSYLKMVKGVNESNLEAMSRQAKDAEAAQRELESWSNEQVGGEENWTAMEAWALDNVSDDELQGFNDAMASGNKFLQGLAIRGMQERWKGEAGDGKPDLLGGNTDAPEDNSTALSAEKYREESRRVDQEFLKHRDPRARKAAMDALDARRRKGLEKGI